MKVPSIPLPRRDRAKRPNRSLRPIRRLLPYIFRYPIRLAAMLGFLLLSTFSSLLIPALGGKVIDAGFGSRDLTQAAQWGWLIVLVSAVMSLAGAARFYFISILGERIVTDLRKSVFDHMLSLDATFFDRHRVGELTSRLNGDVATIRAIVGGTLSSVLRASVVIIGAVTMMLLTSPTLTLAVLLVVPAIMAPILLMSDKLRGLSRQGNDNSAEMSAMATEALGATRTVKSFLQEPEQSRQYGSRAEMSFSTEVSKLGTRAILGASVNFISTAGLVLLVWWGSKEVFDGAVTAGQLAQFMIYALMASNAIQGVSDLFGTLQTIAGSTERLVEILDTKSALPERADPIPLPRPARGALTFEHVSFAYKSRPNDLVLNDLDFAINPGETVALVGHSGAGKSTMFSLMQRFYDVAGGRITIDGVDIRDTPIRDVRQSFAYVEQEPTIFAGTIRDNIRFGRLDATDEQIESSARAALVHNFVEQLSEGYDSVVGERGIMLSGGQKQRLAIARALIKDAPILLLDEATSALDAESEHLVQQALATLMRGRTSLVIAHRLATIRDAHRILVLDKGRLIDQGTHDELVRRGGRYAELARLQFRTEPANAAG